MARPTPGIVERHGRSCPTRTGGRCAKPCEPSFEAWVYSKRDGKKIYKRFPTLAAAKGWRSDALSELRKGKMRAPSGLTLAQKAQTWIEDAKSGAVRTRAGELYKPSVTRGYEADL